MDSGATALVLVANLNSSLLHSIFLEPQSFDEVAFLGLSRAPNDKSAIEFFVVLVLQVFEEDTRHLTDVKEWWDAA